MRCVFLAKRDPFFSTRKARRHAPSASSAIRHASSLRCSPYCCLADGLLSSLSAASIPRTRPLFSVVFLLCILYILDMPPKRNPEDTQSLKAKLQDARGRRTGGATTLNGSTLKEVDNASTNSGATSSDQSSSNVSFPAVHRLLVMPLRTCICSLTSSSLTCFFLKIKWSSQDATVLQSYRRAYRLDAPSAFKNPLSHVVLNQGIGRFSPTMARPKTKRRVHKDQLALAVRRSFNNMAVSESDVIVDWLYKTKNQGTTFTHIQIPSGYRADRVLDKEFRVRFAPQRK